MSGGSQRVAFSSFRLVLYVPSSQGSLAQLFRLALAAILPTISASMAWRSFPLSPTRRSLWSTKRGARILPKESPPM